MTAMKANIEVLLSMWGRWAIRCASGSLGYASVSPMFRDAPSGDSFGDAVPLGIADQDIQAVDQAVVRLPTMLRLVVYEVYQRGGPLRTVATRMGVSHNSVCKYLKAAHEALEFDLESGHTASTAEKKAVGFGSPESRRTTAASAVFLRPQHDP